MSVTRTYNLLDMITNTEKNNSEIWANNVFNFLKAQPELSCFSFEYEKYTSGSNEFYGIKLKHVNMTSWNDLSINSPAVTSLSFKANNSSVTAIATGCSGNLSSSAYQSNLVFASAEEVVISFAIGDYDDCIITISSKSDKTSRIGFIFSENVNGEFECFTQKCNSKTIYYTRNQITSNNQSMEEMIITNDNIKYLVPYHTPYTAFKNMFLSLNFPQNAGVPYKLGKKTFAETADSTYKSFAILYEE